MGDLPVLPPKPPWEAMCNSTLHRLQLHLGVSTSRTGLVVIVTPMVPTYGIDGTRIVLHLRQHTYDGLANPLSPMCADLPFPCESTP